jgi:hypothetical protein
VQAGEVVAGISSLLADPARAGTFYIATNGSGVWRYRSTPASSEPPPLAALVLRPSYPNPFNARTTLHFDIPTALDGARVHLAIYSVRGERLRVLTDEILRAGRHSATSNGGQDASRNSLASGMYHCRLQAGSQRRTQPLVLLK